MNTFSITMPVADRPKMTARAIRSVLNQQYPHWELMVVDDGSNEETKEVIHSFAEKDERIKVLTHDKGYNRAISRNDGMDSSRNDWICWLDSDDEYVSHYLRACDRMINQNPQYKIFNFSHLIYFPNNTSTVRPAFRPALTDVGHEWFRSGNIGTGAFIFRRDLWLSDKKYRIPDEASPYAFAAKSNFDVRLTPQDDAYSKIGDNPEGAFTDGKLRQGLSLGNPWGDDHLQFFKLTRDNYSMPFDIALYIVYPRASEEDYEYF